MRQGTQVIGMTTRSLTLDGGESFALNIFSYLTISRANFPVLESSLPFSTPRPPPPGSIEIIELDENRKVIYGLQSLRGKILSRKDLSIVPQNNASRARSHDRMNRLCDARADVTGGCGYCGLRVQKTGVVTAVDGAAAWSFAPSGLSSRFFLTYPRLAPWAAFFRRFAAGVRTFA